MKLADFPAYLNSGYHSPEELRRLMSGLSCLHKEKSLCDSGVLVLEKAFASFAEPITKRNRLNLTWDYRCGFAL
ncbi:MAG: hypothetical protein ACI4KM_08120 [Oscillospiraceae bacterium]